eukprot:gene10353-12715_t
MENNKITFIYILLFFYSIYFIGIVSSQVQIVDPQSQRTYRIVKFQTGQLKDWQQSSDDAIANGGYLVTITSQHENNLVAQLIKNAQITGEQSLWIGCNGVQTSSKDYKWETGPEKGTLMYSRITNKCYSYCNWSPDQPDGSLQAGNQYERYCHYRVPDGYWNDSPLATPVYGYIMEIGGSQDPYLVPTETDDPTLTINNLIGYNMDNLIITFESTQGLPTFNCVKHSYGTNSFTCTRPAMSGPYNIQINDKVKPIFTIYNVHARVPYISTVIPGYYANDIVTINGQSFGNDLSKIEVLYTINNVNCLPTDWIIPHRSFTCRMANNFVANKDSELNYGGMDRFKVTVNTISNYITKVGFYSKQTSNLILFNNRLNHDYENIYQYEGSTFEWFPFYAGDDVSILRNIMSTGYCYPVTKDGNYFRIKGGDADGQVVVDLNSDPPKCLTIVGCKEVSNSMTLYDYTKYPAFFATYSGKMEGFRTVDSPCSYSFYFKVRLDLPPVFRTPNAFKVPTRGGEIIIPVNNLRLTSNNYTLTRDNVLQPGTIIPQYVPFVFQNSLRVLVGPGTGGARVLNLLIDGMKNEETTSTLAYDLPVIVSLTGSAYTDGSNKVTLVGNNFGNDITKCRISITYANGSPTKDATNLKMETDHSIISFTVPSGTGFFTAQIFVDGQTSSTISSRFVAPRVDNLKLENGDTQCTVSGQFFGTVASRLTVYLDTTEINVGPLTDYGETKFTFQVPPSIKRGNMAFSVDGINSSNSRIIDIRPVIHSISPKAVPYTGGSITLKGLYFTSGPAQPVVTANSVFSCTNTKVLPEELVCTLVNGGGLNNPISVSINNVPLSSVSTPVTISYGPKLQPILNPKGLNVITILGTGFDTDSIVKIGPQLEFTPTPDQLTPSRIILPIPYSLSNGQLTVTSNSITSPPELLRLTPTIESLNSLPTIGGVVTITGTFLNVLKLDGQPNLISISIGGLGCTQLTQGDNNTQLLCTIGGGYGKDLAVDLKIENIPALNPFNLKFSYEAPKFISYEVIQYEPRLVYKYSNIPADKSKLTIKYGSMNPSPDFEVSGDNIVDISFFIPPDTQHGNYFEVSVVGGQTSLQIVVQLQPVLHSIDPVPSIGGITTVKGYYLTHSPIGPNVRIGESIQCTDPVNYPTYLTCTVPPGNGLKLPTTVTTTYKSIYSVPFSYGPSITSVDHEANSKDIYIIGDNYDTDATLTISDFDSTTIPTTRNTTHFILSPIPVDMKNTNLYVTSNGLKSDTVELKLIPFLKTVNQLPGIGGTVIITGTFLNTKRMDGSNTNIVISIGPYSCAPDFDKQPYDNEIFTCNIGSGIGRHPISLSIDGIVAQGNLEFAFEEILVSSAQQDEKSFFIDGYGLGSDISKVIVKLNQETIPTDQCQFTIPNKQIKCSLTKYSMSGPVKLTVNGLE